jgi:hypothetical protein
MRYPHQPSLQLCRQSRRRAAPMRSITAIQIQRSPAACCHVTRRRIALQNREQSRGGCLKNRWRDADASIAFRRRHRSVSEARRGGAPGSGSLHSSKKQSPSLSLSLSLPLPPSLSLNLRVGPWRSRASLLSHGLVPEPWQQPADTANAGTRQTVTTRLTPRHGTT